MVDVHVVVPLPKPGPMPGWLAALLTLGGLALFGWFVVAMAITLLG